jgi:hypothetical protein
MMINLKGEPKSEMIVRIGEGHVLVSYDRKGYLRLMRGAKDGKPPEHKPQPGETVFRVTNVEGGEATYKSSGSHSGLFSINGNVYWSAIWDDVEPAIVKKCAFEDWVEECAILLAEGKKQS